MQGESVVAATVPDRAAVLERCAALAPTLRERAEAAEAARQCPPETIADIRAARLPRTVQPRRYGGHGHGWDVLCEAAMALGHGCGAQAWAATVVCDHPCLAGQFPDEAQREIWGEDPDTLISTSYGPRGTVRRAAGGYVLKGRWAFSSAVAYTDWSIVGGFVEDGAGERRYHFFLVPAEDRRLVDDWYAMGMVGSGSQSFDLDDAFVPEHRALDMRLVRDGCTPGSQVNPEPQFRMPIVGFTGTVLVSVTVGVAEGMVQDFEAMLRRTAGAGPARPGLEELQSRLAEAAAEVQCARLLLLDTVRRNMAKLRAGEKLVEADAARTARDAAYAGRLAKQAATRLFEATGGSGLMLSGHMQRSFRDVYAGAAHGTLSWGRAAARYGNHVLGWPPNLPF